MNLLRKRYDALKNEVLDTESRQFFYELTFDNKGLLLYRGNLARIDACYRLYK